MTEFRLPTIDELLSLRNTPSAPNHGWYWSSSPDASDAGDAWLVFFANGDGGRYSKDFAYRVRLVRTESDGSLVWKDEDEPCFYTWHEAMEKFNGVEEN